MSLIGADHPFFRPLWRRVLLTGLCLGWAAFEFALGSPFWGMLFGGLGLLAAYEFFITYKPPEGGG
jgi:dolichyl-phosphate-mannose--protein O-mannosyl transferase